MLYGKLKTCEEYGFGVFEEKFDSFVDIDDSEHTEIIRLANEENKIIVPDDKGYPILIDSPKPTDKEIAEQKIDELEQYLSLTDWYVIRYADEGKEIPADIKQKRHEAREEISKLRGIE